MRSILYKIDQFSPGTTLGQKPILERIRALWRKDQSPGIQLSNAMKNALRFLWRIATDDYVVMAVTAVIIAALLFATVGLVVGFDLEL